MKIVIGGASDIGIHLAELFAKQHYDCTLMDTDEDSLAGIDADYDMMTLCGSPTSISSLEEAGAGGADLFVAVMTDESQNIIACIIAHSLGAKKTVARIENYEYIDTKQKEFFANIGVDSLIYPELLVATDIVNGLKISWARQRWDVLGGALTLLEVKLHDACRILDRPLRELCGPDDPYTVVAIRRGNETIIPGGNDYLTNLDMVYIMTTDDNVAYIRQLVGKDNYDDVRNVIILGGGKSAERVALNMPPDISLKIIEKDQQRCEQLNDVLGEHDAMVIRADGRDVSLLLEEGIKNTQGFVALTGNAEANILACLTARRLGVRKTIAMVENLDYASMAESLDIGTIINKKTVVTNHIYEMMLGGKVSNMRSLTLVDSSVAELTAAKGSPVTKKAVKDLGLPQGITLGGLVRDGKGMLIDGNTRIMAGDAVLVFSHEQEMRRIEKYFKGGFLGNII